MRDDTAPSSTLVRLIGGLSLHSGDRRIPLPPGSHRLLAYLALHPAGVDRRRAAGALWPTVDEGRAAGNLRSALWRLQQGGGPPGGAGQATPCPRGGIAGDIPPL